MKKIMDRPVKKVYQTRSNSLVPWEVHPSWDAPRSQVIGSPTPRLALGGCPPPPLSAKKKRGGLVNLDDFPRCASVQVYIYLEPVCPLFLHMTPPKQGLFPSKQGSFGFQVVYRQCFLFSSLWLPMILTLAFYPTLLKVTFDVLMCCFNVAFVNRDHQFGEPFSTLYKISFQNVSVW